MESQRRAQNKSDEELDGRFDKEDYDNQATFENEETQLINIGNQLEEIASKINRRQKTPRGNFGWIYIFLFLIALILVAQFIQIQKISKLLNTPPNVTEEIKPTSPPTEAQGTKNDSAETQDAQAALPPTEAAPKYQTLYEWIQVHPVKIKIYTVETQDNTESESEILPVQDGLYIVQFEKTDLDNNTVTRNIHVEISVDMPDQDVVNNGCFVLNYGTDKVVNCEFDPTKPVLIDLNLSFAFRDDGTTKCKNVSLIKPYYTNPMIYNFSVAWSLDDINDNPIELYSAKMLSNLVLPNKDLKLKDSYVTTCEVVLITNQSSISNSTVSVFSYRIQIEDQTILDYLQISPEYLQWLTAPVASPIPTSTP